MLSPHQLPKHHSLRIDAEKALKGLRAFAFGEEVTLRLQSPAAATLLQDADIQDGVVRECRLFHGEGEDLLVRGKRAIAAVDVRAGDLAEIVTSVNDDADGEAVGLRVQLGGVDDEALVISISGSGTVVSAHGDARGVLIVLAAEVNQCIVMQGFAILELKQDQVEVRANALTIPAGAEVELLGACGLSGVFAEDDDATFFDDVLHSSVWMYSKSQHNLHTSIACQFPYHKVEGKGYRSNLFRSWNDQGMPISLT